MSKTVIKSKNDINEAILSAAGKAVADGIFDGTVALPAPRITPAIQWEKASRQYSVPIEAVCSALLSDSGANASRTP